MTDQKIATNASKPTYFQLVNAALRAKKAGEVSGAATPIVRVEGTSMDPDPTIKGVPASVADGTDGLGVPLVQAEKTDAIRVFGATVEIRFARAGVVSEDGPTVVLRMADKPGAPATVVRTNGLTKVKGLGLQKGAKIPSTDREKNITA